MEELLLFSGFFIIIFGTIILFSLGIVIFAIVCNYKIFKKAGKEGWEAIIPIYNIIILCEISKTPYWILILFFLPGAGVLAFNILTGLNLAKAFNKSEAFGLLLAFIPTVGKAILAFNNDSYNKNFASII